MSRTTAREIMSANPITIAPDAGVLEAARAMTDAGVGALPVSDAGRLVGIVTEGDLIARDVKIEYPTYIHLLDGFIMYPPSTVSFEHQLKRAVAATVADVMATDLVTVQVTASLEEVAALLARRDISRLPVLEGDTLVGIVSKHDIVRAIAEGLA
ncbi:MAG TPA: CBS domain-containing protein [Coriobacteriia bacterium]|nr:CBS domain-containing protein [Coriobacteriia bacterium]